jgi:hypothetical protein
MIIALREVPNDERHLLFCSRLLPRRQSRRHRHRRRPMQAARPVIVTETAEQATQLIPLAAGFDAAGLGVA